MQCNLKSSINVMMGGGTGDCGLSEICSATVLYFVLHIERSSDTPDKKVTDDSIRQRKNE